MSGWPGLVGLGALAVLGLCTAAAPPGWAGTDRMQLAALANRMLQVEVVVTQTGAELCIAPPAASKVSRDYGITVSARPGDGWGPDVPATIEPPEEAAGATIVLAVPFGTAAAGSRLKVEFGLCLEGGLCIPEKWDVVVATRPSGPCDRAITTTTLR